MTATQKRRLTVAILLLMAFIAVMYTVQGTLQTETIDFYHLNDAQKGYAGTALSLGGAVALISSLFLIGRLKKTTLLGLASAACVLFFVLLKFANSFNLFIGIWTVIGIGIGYMDTMVSSVIADLYRDNNSARMLSTLHMTNSFAGMLMPFVSTFLLARGLIWGNLYLIVGGLGLAILLYYLFAIGTASNTGTNTVLKGEKPMTAGEKLHLLTHGNLKFMVFGMFFFGMYLNGLIIWVNRYVGVTLNSDLGGIALSFFYLGIGVMRLISAVTKIDAKKYIRVGGLAAGAFLLVAMIFQNGVIMCIGVCLSGLMGGAMIPCMLSIGCANTPQSSMLATTTMVLAQYVGQMLISPIVGALESAFNLHVGIALCAVMTMLSSVFCLMGARKE